MNCKVCGRELEGEAEHCGFCSQIEGEAKGIEPRTPGILRITVGPEDGSEPSLNEDGSPTPSKSAECPECGHTIFKCIGPKFDEPHEHNMLIVECQGCGFKGKMRWKGVAKTTIQIKSNNLLHSKAAKQ